MYHHEGSTRTWLNATNIFQTISTIKNCSTAISSAVIEPKQIRGGTSIWFVQCAHVVCCCLVTLLCLAHTFPPSWSPSSSRYNWNHKSSLQCVHLFLKEEWELEHQDWTFQLWIPPSWGEHRCGPPSVAEWGFPYFQNKGWDHEVPSIEKSWTFSYPSFQLG